jgi:translation initiation factor IF-2
VPPVEPSRGLARALVRPTRIRLCSVALALLGALIFATGANASELVVEQPTVEAELPAVEAPAPEAPAPEAPAPEAPPESPAPEAPAPTPPAGPSPGEAPVVSPPEVRPPEVQVELPASEAIVESSTEPASEKPVAEHPQDPASAASGSEDTVVARGTEASSTKGSQSAGGVGSGPPGPPGAGLALGAPIDPVVPATGAPADGTAEPLTAAGARAASATIAARKSAAFGAGPIDCARALERPGEACSGWVVAPQLSESSVLPLGAPGGPLPPDPNGGATGDGGGHSVVSAPSGNSTPGPSPGGGSGGATAGGGGAGLAPSGALTFAGLLLLAAPRAMRLLRLLCRPWRSACFALIPERPG